MDRQLRAQEARQLARHILENGVVTFCNHAMEELAKDGKTTVDAINVIRGGVYGEAEWINGSWRHRVSTQKFVVVVTFDSESEMIVVTAFART